jgi:uncharacterized protein
MPVSHALRDPSGDHLNTMTVHRLNHRRFYGAAAITIAIGATAVGVAWWRQQRTAPPCSTRAACARECDESGETSCLRLAELLRRGIGGETDWKEAARYQRKACESGVVDACTEMAQLMRAGRGMPRSLAQAQEVLVRSCERSSPKACEVLSEDYRFGVGVPVDGARADALAVQALGLHRQRCDRDDSSSCLALARRLLSGMGTPKDEAQAAMALERGRKLQSKACDAGDLLACQALPTGQSKADPAKRFTTLQRGCELDDGISCYLLAQPLLGARRAGTEATVATMERACALGVAAACEKLGTWSEKGEGVPRDPTAAVAWLRKSADIRMRQCDTGDAGACLAISEQFSEGRGVPQDNVKAAQFASLGLTLHSDSCEAGDTYACGEAGDILSSSLSRVPNDLARAAAFYEIGCRRGVSFSCASLARLYQKGRGVPRDDERAASLLRRACDADDAVSCFKVGDATRGIVIYERECDNGSWLSCADLSMRYEKGDGVPVDQARAEALNARACLFGGGHDCQKYPQQE